MTEAQEFIFGLEQSRPKGGMRWHGNIPKEVIDLFQLKNISESSHGCYVAGIYVQLKPKYEPFKPDWEKDEA